MSDAGVAIALLFRARARLYLNMETLRLAQLAAGQPASEVQESLETVYRDISDAIDVLEKS